MIICICPNEQDAVYRDGKASQDAFPAVFRSTHLVFREEIPQLAPNEDLFIIAHGGFDVDGRPVIGELGGNGLRLDAFTLWMNIADRIPADYYGDLYVSTCYSASPGQRGTVFSFVELLAACVKADRNANCNVFGHDGLIAGLIPLPGDAAWAPAEIG